MTTWLNFEAVLLTGFVLKVTTSFFVSRRLKFHQKEQFRNIRPVDNHSLPSTRVEDARKEAREERRGEKFTRSMFSILEKLHEEQNNFSISFLSCPKEALFSFRPSKPNWSQSRTENQTGWSLPVSHSSHFQFSLHQAPGREGKEHGTVFGTTWNMAYGRWEWSNKVKWVYQAGSWERSCWQNALQKI